MSGEQRMELWDTLARLRLLVVELQHSLDDMSEALEKMS